MNALPPSPVEMRTARPELKSRIPQLVQLYEVDSSRLTAGDDDRPRMPAECGDLEALIVCFDVGDQTSLQGIVELCRAAMSGASGIQLQMTPRAAY
jgi:hypothetical protein